VGASLKTRNGLFPTGKLWLSFLVIASKNGDYAEDGGGGVCRKSDSAIAINRGGKR